MWAKTRSVASAAKPHGDGEGAPRKGHCATQSHELQMSEPLTRHLGHHLAAEALRSNR